MKKFPLVLLAVLTLPAHSASRLEQLKKHKSTLKAGGGTSSSGTVGETSTTAAPKTSIIDDKCEEEDNTSLTLNFMDSLLLEEGGKFEFRHNPREGSLTVSSPKMIGNCSQMFDWGIKPGTVANDKAYVLEVKINPPQKYKDEAGAEIEGYKFLKMVDGKPKFFVQKFEANYSGVEKCLEAAGVFKEDGTVNKEAVYAQPVAKKFTDVTDTSKLLFMSHGLRSTQDNPLYGKDFVAQNKCDFYENTTEGGQKITSAEDEAQTALSARVTELQSCTSEEYQKVIDFLSNNQNGDLQKTMELLLDKLLKEAAEKSAINIAKGEFTADDLKVAEDYDKYVVVPEVSKARDLYNQMNAASGNRKTQLQEDLKAQVEVLKKLNSKPYYTEVQTQKLLDKGYFEDAIKLNVMSLNINSHKALGLKQNNIVVTPAVASMRLASERKKFEDDVVVIKEKYEIKTGQTTGKALAYNRMAQQMRKNAMTRTQNKTQLIQQLYADIQQGGYCLQWYRQAVAPKCIQERLDEIAFHQKNLANDNQVDMERAAEYNSKAVEYNALENEGRRYIATQNGEEAPKDAAAPTAVDTTVPTGASAADLQSQTQAAQQDRLFQQQVAAAQAAANPMLGAGGQAVLPQNFAQYGMQAQYGQNFQQFPQYTQQGVSPYMGQQAYVAGSQYGYQNPQMNWFGNGGAQVNYGVGAQVGAGGQQGYWGQPATAYGYPNYYRGF